MQQHARYPLFINESSGTTRLHMEIEGYMYILHITTQTPNEIKGIDFLLEQSESLRKLWRNTITNRRILVVAIEKIVNKKFLLSCADADQNLFATVEIDSAILQKERNWHRMKSFEKAIEEFFQKKLEDIPVATQVAFFVLMYATRRIADIEDTSGKSTLPHTEVLKPEEEDDEQIQWLIMW